MQSQNISTQTDRQDITARIAESMEKVSRLWKLLLAQELRGERVSLSQYMAMRAISDVDTVGSRKLGDMLHITSGAVTQVIDSLVEGGYVIRRTDSHDRRITTVSLTEAGIDKLEKLQQIRQGIYNRVFKDLADNELVDLFSHIEQVHLQLRLTQQPNDK
jgi:DNA-binding MarR family transcriptional regulator